VTPPPPRHRPFRARQHGAANLRELQDPDGTEPGTRVPNPDGKWYRRFAAVPGVGYEGDLRLRERLPARNATPKVTRYEFDGSETISLMWPTLQGESSASPVHQLAFGIPADEPSEKTRERVLTALELPGELSDYHFAIQGAGDASWKRRRVAVSSTTKR
jgi:hypothetical protein